MQYYRDKVMHVPKYNNASWHYKVERMSDAQVIALYYKFKKDGLFDKQKKSRGENSEKYYQMTIFDFIKEENNG